MVLSDLQLSLAAAGVLVVAAVWVYNLMQEHKHRKAAERIFSERHEDVLADAEVAVPAVPVFERVEPVVEGMSTAVPASAGELPDEPDESLLDTFVELVVTLDCAREIPARKLMDTLESLRAAIPKRQRCIIKGANGWNELALTGEGTRHLRYALQLADRQGAAAAADINTLISAMNRLSDEFEGKLRPVDVAAAAGAAQALDVRCAATDVQIAVHLVHRTGARFAASKLRQLLEAAGLVLAADGNFHLCDTAGNGLFSVSGDGAIPFTETDAADAELAGITFWLDVPHVADGGVVFERMTALARALCRELDGVLVDDQRRALGDVELAGIGRKILEIQADMAAAEFPAGGRRALRLFA